MKKKIEYDPEGSVVLENVEWTWESLKQVCHSAFVHDAKARGHICNQYKVPREILNEWIDYENWEYDKKSFWQRPYSYRIDSALNELINNVNKLAEIQEEVKDIDFEPDRILSRVKINIQIKEDGKWKELKTLLMEKYSVVIEGISDYIGTEEIVIAEDSEEMRYKTSITEEEILIRYLKQKGKIKKNI